MNTLILMRHGKAVREWEAETDHDRRLTERGQNDSVATAKTLHEMCGTAGLVLVSTAARTQGTWAAMSNVWPAYKMVLDEELYLASAETLRDLIGGYTAMAEDGPLVIIGHNPGLHDLAVSLCQANSERSEEAGEGHDGPSAARLAQGLPTAAACVFQRRPDETAHADDIPATASQASGATAPSGSLFDHPRLALTALLTPPGK